MPNLSNKNKYEWEESVFVARKALTQPVVHTALAQQNALFYHNNQVNPGWHLRRITQIGNHIFYNEHRI
jgi:spore germination cell wall hydrolase CwlJ-like protein